jgi:hypothetical protein
MADDQGLAKIKAAMKDHIVLRHLAVVEDSAVP